MNHVEQVRVREGGNKEETKQETSEEQMPMQNQKQQQKEKKIHKYETGTERNIRQIGSIMPSVPWPDPPVDTNLLAMTARGQAFAPARFNKKPALALQDAGRQPILGVLQPTRAKKQLQSTTEQRQVE